MSDDESGYAAPSSSARIVWAIATAEQPMTSSEIADEIGVTNDTVQNAIIRLYHDGRVLRRRRRDSDNFGPDPYEYRLTSRDEHESLKAEAEREFEGDLDE